MKKYSYIKEMKTDELEEKITSEKEALLKLKLNHAVAPLENPMQMKAKRKMIARLATELNNR